MSISHSDPHCTGRWYQKLIGGTFYWLCDRCQAVGYTCEATAYAAIRENQLGTTLHNLSNAGEYLLLSEEDEEWKW